jgi:hypothetical protein
VVALGQSVVIRRNPFWDTLRPELRTRAQQLDGKAATVVGENPFGPFLAVQWLDRWRRERRSWCHPSELEVSP